MQLLYGTGNPAKLIFAKRCLAELNLDIIGLKDISSDIPYVPENGATPLENAKAKALTYYNAFKIPVFSCDSGLYFNNLPDNLQPGVHVRTVNGKRLNDAEMIDYYSSLARHYGDLTARYKNAVCFVQDEQHVYEAMDATLESEPFLITSKPHSRIEEGFPLDSLSVDIHSGKYYYDLPVSQEDNDLLGDGLLMFFQKILI